MGLAVQILRIIELLLEIGLVNRKLVLEMEPDLRAKVLEREQKHEDRIYTFLEKFHDIKLPDI